MAAKRSDQAKEKGTKKSGAKQKSNRNIFQADPPIIVGGGGSAYVWIKKTLLPKMIDPNSVHDHPAHPDLYYCFV